MKHSSASTAYFDVCALAEISDGGVRIFQLHIGQNELQVLVLRSGESCYGYINRCPHFGVPLATCDSQLIYEPNHWIKCNVHYSRFRWQDGYCESGECVGESLRSVPLEIEDGTIRLNLQGMEFPHQAK